MGRDRRWGRRASSTITKLGRPGKGAVAAGGEPPEAAGFSIAPGLVHPRNFIGELHRFGRFAGGRPQVKQGGVRHPMGLRQAPELASTFQGRKRLRRPIALAPHLDLIELGDHRIQNGIPQNERHFLLHSRPALRRRWSRAPARGSRPVQFETDMGLVGRRHHFTDQQRREANEEGNATGGPREQPPIRGGPTRGMRYRGRDESLRIQPRRGRGRSFGHTLGFDAAEATRVQSRRDSPPPGARAVAFTRPKKACPHPRSDHHLAPEPFFDRFFDTNTEIVLWDAFTTTSWKPWAAPRSCA